MQSQARWRDGGFMRGAEGSTTAAGMGGARPWRTATPRHPPPPEICQLVSKFPCDFGV